MDEVRCCEECGADISHKKRSARRCSEACSYAARERVRRAEWVNSRPACEVCGVSIAHKRAGSRWCSRGCKSESSTAVRRNSECMVCGVDITGLSKIAKYCGGACRTAFNEGRVEAHLRRLREGARCAWCDEDILHLGGHYRYCGAKCKRLGQLEYLREWKRDLRSRDVERARSLDRQYYAARSAQVKAKVNRRRARVLGNDARLVTDRDIDRMLSLPCAYCACCKSEEIDHIIPLARGGRDAVGNLVGACSFCNRSKSDKLLVEWRQSFREGVVSTHAFGREGLQV